MKFVTQKNVNVFLAYHVHGIPLVRHKLLEQVQEAANGL